MRLKPISRRIVAQLLIDTILIAFANLVAFGLKYDRTATTYAAHLGTATHTLPILIGLRLLALRMLNLHRIHWRYMSIRDLWSVAGATTLSSLAFFVVLSVVGLGSPGAYSWSMQVIDWMVNICLLSFVRIIYRQVSDKSLLGLMSVGNGNGNGNGSNGIEKPRQRALIVGAGDSGEAVVRDLLRRPHEGIIPVGFVDDDPLKRTIRIHGLPVFGTTQDIATIAHNQSVALILIALPSASGTTIRDIFARCEETRARLCIVPNVGDMLDNVGGIPGRMREIRIEDLLRRAPVRTDMEGIANYISGQRVLVTGAGGSIGSELCRQICALNPARLILVGRGENSIFEIEQELIREFGYAPTTVIGDVKDHDRMEEIFLYERPTVVFHAAAHKHVPLMEANPGEAIKNNVLGTRNVATIAAQCGVKKFLLVSTDKAVNPSSVMGASKRIAEMLIQSIAQATNTEFAVVRFGNVLGSRGSVIPTMRKQIARGGPVTVTHPDMTRYFMTIPEAVQLILQAGAWGARGEIFILDMGEPVRILDLASDLVRLSGFRPGVDIKIEITGIRPGEKIHEELLYPSECKEGTAHEKIFVSNGCDHLLPGEFLPAVDRLIRLALEGERDTLRDEIIRLAHTGNRERETVSPVASPALFSLGNR